jgi:hypothetical protein
VARTIAWHPGRRLARERALHQQQPIIPHDRRLEARVPYRHERANPDE